VEDIFRGDVLWVYYNRYTLKYICEKNGFRYIKDQDVMVFTKSGAPWFTVRYFLFKKDRTVAPDAKDLGNSRLFQETIFETLKRNFAHVTADSIKRLDDPNTFAIGTKDILFDLCSLSGFKVMGGFTDYRNPQSGGFTLQGVKILSIEQLRDICNSNKETSLFIASFKYQQEIIDYIASQKLTFKKIICPDISSGIERILDERLGLSKALRLKETSM
jgi:hypothetical protein